MGRTPTSRIKQYDTLIALALARARSGGSSASIPDLPFTSIYVNTATGNNSNPGTALRPIQTTDRLNELLFGRMQADLLISYQNDDTSGQFLELGGLQRNGFTVTLQMTPVVVHTGGTIDAGTLAMNPAAANGGQRQTLHTTDVADWTPFVMPNWNGTATHMLRAVDAVTQAIAWLGGVGAPFPSPIGPATATMSPALLPDTSGFAPLTIGNSYTLVRGGIVTLGSTGPDGVGGFVCNDAEFTLQTIGWAALNLTSNAGFLFTDATWNRCAFLGMCQPPGFYNNCVWAGGVTGAGVKAATGGLWDPVNNTNADTVVVSGDMLIASPTGIGVILGQGTLRELTIETLLGFGDRGAQFSDCRGVNRGGLNLAPGGDLNCDGLIWGNGNQGLGMVVLPGAHYWVNQSTSPPSVTGAVGDYNFFATSTPTSGVVTSINVARAWDNAAGAYTEAGGPATRATTWANLIATIGAGGFNGTAVCLEQDSSISISGRGL